MSNLTPPPGPFAGFFTAVSEAIRQLQQPRQPVQFYGVTQANLPPAASWTYGAIYVTDLNTLAVSTGSSWVRADGSAL